MRLTITFQALEPIAKFPLHYNYALQSFIYHHISTNLADFLHNRGYRYEKRVFRLFTFSRLLGKYQIEKNSEITFTGFFKLQIGSPIKDLLEEFAETLARAPEVSIENNSLLVSSIEVHLPPPPTQLSSIRMLSPTVVYSTLSTLDGKKKTYYYSPFEREFSNLIQKNLLKKYISFYDAKPTSTEFKISPLRVDKRSEKIIKYTPKKGSPTIIKAWMGIYRIEGNPELISFAWDTGLGAKTSQGFGMFEVIRERQSR